MSRFGQIITGHNNLRYHQYVQNNMINPNCRLCDLEPATFIHLCTNCPRLRQMRNEIFLDIEVKGTESWAIGRILEFSNIPAIDTILIQEF